MGDKKSLEELEAMFKDFAMLTSVPKEAMKPIGFVADLPPLELSEDEKRKAEEKLLRSSFSFAVRPINAPNLFFIGADFSSEPSKESCALVIQSEPKINKPKNLKYPNKKRARRIWKKWKHRFGETPGKAMCLPNVGIVSKIVSEHDGYLRYDVTTNPIKNDNGDN